MEGSPTRQLSWSPLQVKSITPRTAVVLLAVLAVVVGLAAGLGCQQMTAIGATSSVGTSPVTTNSPGPPVPMFRLVAVGDIMLDRKVGERIRKNGARSILAKVRDHTRAGYITFGNLECPLSTEGPHNPPNCIFRAAPESVAVLTDGGFDVVSLANNHTLDAGRAGVLQTLATLDRAGIRYVGARADRNRGWDPVFLVVGGARVGFMACTDLSFEHGSYAKFSEDPQRAAQRVAEAARQCDVLFVSVHWGEEYQTRPTDRQRATARKLIDAGADCILGHHPHVLQGIGTYKGCPILYSMGNFVFDQRQGERMESAIFDLWWKKGGLWQIKATPVWIEPTRLGPIYPPPERAKRIADRLHALSEGLGSRSTLSDDRVVVHIAQATSPAYQRAPVTTRR